MGEIWRRYKKWIMIAGGVVGFLLIVVVVVNVVLNAIYSAGVNIYVAPSIAKVKIGGNEFTATGEHKILPGEYDVEVSAEGFVTRTGTLTAVSGETAEIKLFLTPDEGNSDWYNTHPYDGLIMGEIKNDQTVKALQELGEEYPILNILPYTAEYFTDDYSAKIKYMISYKTDAADEDFVIVITDYMGGAKEVAYKWLEDNGVDASKVTIEYKDISSSWMITGSAE